MLSSLTISTACIGRIVCEAPQPDGANSFLAMLVKQRQEAGAAAEEKERRRRNEGAIEVEVVGDTGS